MSSEVNTEAIKGMLVPDLRVALRSRGLSPAGSREVLQDRLNEFLNESGQPAPRAAYNPPPSSGGESECSRNVQRQASSLNYLFGGADEGPISPPAGDPGRRAHQGVPQSQIFGADDMASQNHYAQAPPQAQQQSAAPAQDDEGFSKEDQAVIAAMPVPDLRAACRRFGLSPAGQRSTLQQRLTDYFMGKASDAEFTGNNESSAAIPTWMQGPAAAPQRQGGNPGRNSQLGYLFSGGAAS